MSEVQGRVALVTGGTRGIGEAVSVALKNAGRFVVANYAGNEHAAADFQERTSIQVKRFDVSDSDATETAIRDIEAKFGPIEILVNNAGITRDGTIHRMDRAQWQAVIDTNLSGCFNCSRSVIEGMRERSFGRIVNIGSINGQAGQYGQVNYAAAKSGIHGFTKALAQEGAAKGITVNAIAPGAFSSEMMDGMLERMGDIAQHFPRKRICDPAQLDSSLLYFLSPASEAVTGTFVKVDDGQGAR